MRRSPFPASLQQAGQFFSLKNKSNGLWFAKVPNFRSESDSVRSKHGLGEVFLWVVLVFLPETNKGNKLNKPSATTFKCGVRNKWLVPF